MPVPDSNQQELPEETPSRGLRSRVLRRIFDALYGPLVFLHEPAGRCLFGSAWHGRRLEMLARMPCDSLVLDLACGDGRLLRELGSGIGVDLSMPVLQRARGSGSHVVVADARALPFRDSSFGGIVCTYPGPWIVDSRVWTELARVTGAGAPVSILLGVTIERGTLALPRRLALRVLYGTTDPGSGETHLTGLGSPQFDGSTRVVEDRWGKALVWDGVRRCD